MSARGIVGPVYFIGSCATLLFGMIDHADNRWLFWRTPRDDAMKGLARVVVSAALWPVCAVRYVVCD